MVFVTAGFAIRAGYSVVAQMLSVEIKPLWTT
jgi:hypothetical protein